ncbi:MAG: hypothetical protein LBS74_03430 [Oscillospiraceae bacterium]|jgi:uncharacterized FAD-dependent dehydrogenase|nr:hypothetical protein [Oscillospiraceae bacterium]
MLIINNISLRPEQGEHLLTPKAADALKIPPQSIRSVKILKRSADARKKYDIRLHYSLAVSLNCDEQAVLECNPKLLSYEPYVYNLPQNTGRVQHPVVVGSGPAGLFAGLILAEAGLNPLILERGKPVDLRRKDVQALFNTGELNPESNVQFGEGGAGTFSDGKLTTGTKNPRSAKVIEEFIKAGAPAEIAYQAKPHIGTDYLMRVVKGLRERIEALGGRFLFQTKLEGLILREGRLCALRAGGAEIEADAIILAIGHSARDTFEMLLESGVPMEAKPFSVGARIEHPQALIDSIQYGSFAGSPALGAADYKLAVHLPNGRGVYTFCMCPGGQVVAAASESGGICTNGMSLFARKAANANSALLVGVNPEDFGSSHPLAGMEFQRKIEAAAYKLSGSYRAPAQLAGDLIANRTSKRLGAVRPSYHPGVLLGELSCLPEFVRSSLAAGIAEMEKKLRGFALADAVLTAPETRSSSPVRILRGEDLQSAIKGLYPCGEGAGYAGGIISAAVDGILCAEAVLNK